MHRFDKGLAAEPMHMCIWAYIYISTPHMYMRCMYGIWHPHTHQVLAAEPGNAGARRELRRVREELKAQAQVGSV